MDTFLFVDRVPEGQLPDDGPENERRPGVYVQSLWFNGDQVGGPFESFENYLTVRGWSEQHLLTGRWQDAHPDNLRKDPVQCIYDSIAVIQGWMTFGFLGDLFQTKEWLWPYLQPLQPVYVEAIQQYIPTPSLWERLRRNLNAEVKIFHTKHLVSNLTALALAPYTALLRRDSAADPSLEQMQRLPTLIARYMQAFNRLAGLDDYNEAANYTRYPIQPNIPEASIFHYQLGAFALVFEAIQVKLAKFSPDIDMATVSTERMIRRSLMIQDGWCPHVLEKISQTTSYSVLHWIWASKFGCLDRRQHDTCTEQRCLSIVVASEEDYEQQHHETCGRTCGGYHPPVQEILDDLHNDKIPLIVASRIAGEGQMFTFSSGSYDPKAGTKQKYVAISHVWSDGLGSWTERGLRSCQMQFLARVVARQLDDLEVPMAFWIDSLCIPAERSARSRAINLMSSVYRSAHVTVVLDATLRQISLIQTAMWFRSPEYLLLRVLSCPWSFRVWTYQEAVLSKRLVFLLAGDEQMVLDFPMDLDGGPTRGPLSIPLGRDLLHNIYTLLRWQVQNLNYQLRPINIGDMASELRWRDTLHRNPAGRNDEILAVASLLDLDLGALQAVPEGYHRMATFYRLIRRLHSNIIFAEAPRLPIDGFRWAPNTFLVNDPRRPHSNLRDRGVDVNDEGLRGRYLTFAARDGEVAHFDNRTALTMADGERWYDLVAPMKTDFYFTHVLCYPHELGVPRNGDMFVAAAVLEDKTQPKPEGADFVAVFQTVVHGCCMRERNTPVNVVRWPGGRRDVNGVFQTLEVLLR